MQNDGWMEYPDAEALASSSPQPDQKLEESYSGSEIVLFESALPPVSSAPVQSEWYAETAGAQFPTPPRRRLSAVRIVGLVAIALTVILASVGGVFLVSSYQTAQRQQARSTATAQADAHQIALANSTVTAQAQATKSSVAATATTIAANPNPYPPYLGTLALKDSFDDTSNTTFFDIGDCAFHNSAYQVSTIGGNHFTGCSSETTYRNVTMQVEMKVLKGAAGGVFFHYDRVSMNYYYLIVFQDGTWVFGYHFGKTGSFHDMQVSKSPAIKTGLGSTNLVAIVANGDTYSMYVNKSHLFTETIQQANGAFQEGEIDLCAISEQQATTVAYDNIEIWTF